LNFDSWLFFQLGAREHYALPRAFHQRGELAALFTDAWLAPRSPWHAFLGVLPRLSSRYEPDLREARVEHFTGSLLWFEAQRAIKGRADAWDDIVARNKWFQRQTIRRLARTGLFESTGRGCGIVHAFSYAARDILAAAKSAGHLTVLGQIDPGIMEEGIVRQACMKRRELLPDWTPAPPEYWDNWREECRLADVIVVNSEWSRRGIVAKGASPEKIFTIPLIYEAPSTNPIAKSFPDRFDKENPLTVLFLGTVCVRKGIAELLEAIDLLHDAPVKFLFVGPSEICIPERLQSSLNIQWVGSVPRGKVHDYYRNSHLFILPTLSDGFGLTQLEAQAWGLPVIASRNCGEVVRERENGLLLSELSGASIAQAIESILKRPDYLPAMSKRSQEIVKEYSRESVLPKYVSAVRQVAADNRFQTR
jgi:glycosyltransferase involved in cell wall biosynthesis